MSRPALARWRLPALFAALLIVVAACAPQQSAEEPAAGGGEGGGEPPEEIVIGATLPLTGAESRAGRFYQEGYQLAFDLANEDGGIDMGGTTVPVRLELLDDTSVQATAVNLANRLINQDGIRLLLGTYSTALVQAQSTVAQQNQVPYVNGGGAATAIYERGYDWIFGTLAPVEQLALTQMEWITQQQEAGNLPNPARIALLWENTSHGEDYRKGVQDAAAESNGAFEVVVDASFELESADFSAILSQVEAANADLFLVDAHLPDYITMHRQYTTRGMCHDIITYGARGSESDAAEAIGQDQVAYILSAVWWNAQLGEEGLNKEFVEAFKAAHDGREPEWYQAVAYSAAQAMFAGISEAGSVEPAAVKEALINLQMPSILPGGELTFPEDTGHQAIYPFVVQQNMPDGSAPIIYPADVATGEGVAPNPNCGG